MAPEPADRAELEPLGSSQTMCSSLVVVSRAMTRPHRIAWSARPLAGAALVYVLVTLCYLFIASPSLWREHTPYNHFALLAESWLRGRLDLGRAPPLYAGGNDFALYSDRWYVVFPGMPALLILPWVAMAGGATKTLDGLFFLLLSGLGPAGMYLALDRLRCLGLAAIQRSHVLVLTSLYAFGTVYFFTATQGTVWFAAHVVAAAATSFYLCAAIGLSNPLGAGIALGVAMATRPSLGALGLFFLFEWWRVAGATRFAVVGATPPTMKMIWLALKRSRVDVWRPLFWFGLPVAITVFLLGWHNWARFGSPAEFGYRYLTVAWHARIEKWGLFGYHYLARNLGLILTSLPYIERDANGWSLQVNGHGLALWVTTPLYLWLLWPRQKTLLHRAVYVTLGAVALPSLTYQNSGWIQFGQRFSNDYAPLLILLLALGGYHWGRLMKLGWASAIAINLFGAVTFGRPEYGKYYFIERTQRVIYQLD